MQTINNVIPVKPAVKTSLMEFKQVTKTYNLGSQQVHALRGIDLSIYEGQFLAIAGPSGSGKSTFLNLASMIDTPTSGQINYAGVDVKEMNDNEITKFRNKKIGIVFQSFNLFPVLNAVENVAFALQVQNVAKSESFDRAEALLREVGLGAHLSHRPGKLSGGQRQRVAIARALVAQPEIVIADEPTSALDSQTGLEIIALMKKLNRTHKTTFLFSTHDNRIMDQVNQVIDIEDGLIKD